MTSAVYNGHKALNQTNKDLYIDSIGGDVLGQLSSMRKKLESERRRVENQLENQRVGVDEVFMTNF